MSRLDDLSKSRVIVIAHRLAENDLPGHILKEGGWKHVCLPMIAEADEILEPDGWKRKAGDLLRVGAYSDSEIAKLKARTGSPGFRPLYQQNPSNRSYERLDASCFGIYHGIPQRGVPVVLSVDPAQTTKDSGSFSVIQAWAAVNDKHILIDQARGHMSFETLLKALRTMCRRHRPDLVLIENSGVGPALEAFLRSKNRYQVELVDVRGIGKLERFTPHAELFRQHRILVSDHVADRDIFIEEHIEFPNYGSDDQVDATSQYLARMKNGVPLPKPTERGLFALSSHADAAGSFAAQEGTESGSNVGVLRQYPRSFG